MATIEKRTYTDSGLCDLIKDFLAHFKDKDGSYKYVNAIDQAIQYTIPTVIISPKDFLESELESGIEINDLMYSNCKRFLIALNRAVEEIFQTKAGKKIPIDIQIDSVSDESSVIQALSKKQIGKLTTVKGMIVYKSDIFNKCKKAVYKCDAFHPTIIEFCIGDSENKLPLICDNANCKNRNFVIDAESSEWETYRNIAIKSDEDFSFSNDELTISLSGQLTEAVEAGDRIFVTGVVYVKNKPKSNIFKNEVHCLYIRKLDDIDLNITSDDEEVFRNMICETDFYQKMINSIAPQILGYEEIKESLLLQLIRSPTRLKPDNTTSRGWFNIGLWGDAGVAKTAMAEHINANYPKTQIISSRGATDVGLTLGIDKDSSGNSVLRAGAFVLNRGHGIVILDEFPRLNPEVVDGIMTTIESGFASIAKAGFQANQRADSSLLATGNAYGEDWNDGMNLKDNLNVSTPLLSRFDYHWIIKDVSTKQRDSDIADAIMFGVEHDESFKPYSSSLLVKYFKFVRQFEPELTDEVAQYLKSSYVQLRSHDKAKENGISPRHLNTLIRTTLAISRLYQRKYAVVEDAENAITLMKKNLDQRGISVSEANTYTIRQFNRCIDIIKEASSMGIALDDVFDKLQTSGSKEQIDQCVLDLGKEKELRHNKKWRNVVSKLRRSMVINIISEKPMILSFKHEKRF